MRCVIHIDIDANDCCRCSLCRLGRQLPLLHENDRQVALGHQRVRVLCPQYGTLPCDHHNVQRVGLRQLPLG